MVAFRSAIPDFQLANPLYRGATVNFYVADAAGNPTSELAELYGAPTGNLRVTNPQVLDGDGKFFRPVYFKDPIVGSVVSANVEGHITGVIYPRGAYRGIYTPGVRYGFNDLVIGPGGNDQYAASSDFTATAFADDVAAQRLVFVIGIALLTADKQAAQAAAAAAATSATNAAASALLAQQAAGSVDAQTIAARFLALENRADVLEGEDYRSEQIALGIAYQGVR